jgi:hypothetical protein
MSMSVRTEPRMTKQANVRIFGMDSKGRPINLPVSTVDISKHGARVTGVKSWDYPGDTIGIRYGTEKARYRIVWIGLPNSQIDGQVGLYCVDQGRYIWDFAAPVAEMQAGHSTPYPALSHTLGSQIGLAPTIPHYADRRRKDQRFIVQGGANVREVGKNVPQWTMLHDLSMGGCYVETTAPLAVYSRVEISIQVGELRIDAHASVVVRHPLVGMGLKFGDMSPLNRDRLRQLIGRLEHAESASAG